MEVQSHFKNIRDKISTELKGATAEISAAIAWMTDPILFDALIDAARRRVKVRLALLDDEINARSGLNMERLRALGGEVYLLPPAEGAVGGLHHKFCVVDRHVVITGSYNWTRRASSADENILLVRGDAGLADGYESAFDDLLRKYGFRTQAPKIDAVQLRLRLTVILNLVQLSDEESLVPQIEKLDSAHSKPEIASLISHLQAHRFRDAETLLKDLIARATALIPSEATEVVALKLELKTLEAQVIALATEQADMERTIADFSHRHFLALGDALSELLELRVQVRRRQAARSGAAADREAEAEAETERENWRSTRQEAIEQAPPTLNAEEQVDLKKFFREASMLCHPDRVGESDREEAAAVFIRLRDAYQRNDIDEVRRLHRQLRQGRPFSDLSESLNEADLLRRQISRLRLDADRLMGEIGVLRSSETWQTIEAIDDWDRWFGSKRKRVVVECDALREQLGIKND